MNVPGGMPSQESFTPEPELDNQRLLSVTVGMIRRSPDNGLDAVTLGLGEKPLVQFRFGVGGVAGADVRTVIATAAEAIGSFR